MKLVLNKCFGGFGISEEAMKLLGVEDAWDIERDDSRLISLIETKGSEFVSEMRYARLKVVEFSDEATDWEIDEYDGSETLTYVVNGKIHHA